MDLNDRIKLGAEGSAQNNSGSVVGSLSERLKRVADQKEATAGLDELFARNDEQKAADAGIKTEAQEAAVKGFAAENARLKRETQQNNPGGESKG